MNIYYTCKTLNFQSNHGFTASLNDPSSLFNSGLDSQEHRSINIKEGEQIDDGKLRDLIKQAITLAK